MDLSDAPGTRGFSLPAEWARQASVWLAWPRDPTTWPDRLDAARRVYLEAMRHITAHQRVDLIVHPELHDDAKRAVTGAGIHNVVLHPVVHQDGWVRDYGPIVLRHADGRRLATKWRFDAWGGKYESLRKDDAVVGRLERQDAIGMPVERIDRVLEGGSIESDGEGTLLTTEQCLLHRNRNGWDKETAEMVLCSYLGMKKVLWLGDGIQGDDTDGHVDDITRFVAPGHVVTCVAGPDHPDHAALQANLERLRTMTDARGRTLRVTELPMPPLQETSDGEPLPASHANLLITNGCVLMPAFGGGSDAAAARILEGAIGRPVVSLDCTDLVWGMGAIHCLSMQVPA